METNYSKRYLEQREGNKEVETYGESILALIGVIMLGAMFIILVKSV